MMDLDSYRAAALALGIPEPASDWWLSVNRPGVLLGSQLEGRLAGHLGGSPSLPRDVDWPIAPAAELGTVSDLPIPFIASIDCTNLPAHELDIDLPDGTLLFFSFVDLFDPYCQVIHVPTGTELDTRAAPVDDDGDPPEMLPFEPLHAVAARTFTGTEHGYPPQDGLTSTIDDNMLEKLAELTREPGELDTVFQIGGHPYVIRCNPEEDADDREQSWVLLAQMFLWARDDLELDGEIVYWTISRADLTNRRFDRVRITVEISG